MPHTMPTSANYITLIYFTAVGYVSYPLSDFFNGQPVHIIDIKDLSDKIKSLNMGEAVLYDVKHFDYSYADELLDFGIQCYLTVTSNRVIPDLVANKAFKWLENNEDTIYPYTKLIMPFGLSIISNNYLKKIFPPTVSGLLDWYHEGVATATSEYVKTPRAKVNVSIPNFLNADVRVEPVGIMVDIRYSKLHKTVTSQAAIEIALHLLTNHHRLRPVDVGIREMIKIEQSHGTTCHHVSPRKK